MKPKLSYFSPFFSLFVFDLSFFFFVTTFLSMGWGVLSSSLVFFVFSLFTLLFLKLTPPSSFPKEEHSQFLGVFLGMLCASGVIVFLFLFVIEKNIQFHSKLKPVSWEEFQTSTDSNHYTSISLSDLSFDQMVKEIKYNRNDDKTYEGEFLVLVPSLSNSSISVWILENHYGTKRESELISRLKDRLSEKKLGYFRQAETSDYHFLRNEDANIKASSLGLGKPLVVVSIDPGFDFSFWELVKKVILICYHILFIGFYIAWWRQE